MLNHKYWFLVLLFVTFLSGCSQNIKGVYFQPLANIPQDKAVIYIYWTDKGDIPGAHRVSYSLKANSENIVTMKSGGYYPLVVPTGTVKLSTKVNFNFPLVPAANQAGAPVEELEITVRPNHSYYVRCISRQHKGLLLNSYTLSMTLLDDAKRAKSEMRSAKQLNGENTDQTALTQNDTVDLTKDDAREAALAFNPPAGSAYIYLAHTGGWQPGAGPDLRVWLDDPNVVITEFPKDSFYVLEVSPGPHALGAKMQYATGKHKVIQMECVAGEVYFVEYVFRKFGSDVLSAVPPDEGKEFVQKYNMIR